MIARTIVRRGITNTRVLEALNNVKREEFVTPELAAHAYDDSPLDIGNGQTISQPYIVALMADALKIQPTSKVLDIGTGCGYSAAVYSRMTNEQVHTIERIPDLAQSARIRLQKLGFSNVFVHEGDGTLGLPEYAPYDAISVAAGAPTIPNSLISQLNEGGRIVIPIENDGYQELVLGIRQGDRLKTESLGGVRFVPLLGEEGWRN